MKKTIVLAMVALCGVLTACGGGGSSSTPSSSQSTPTPGQSTPTTDQSSPATGIDAVDVINPNLKQSLVATWGVGFVPTGLESRAGFMTVLPDGNYIEVHSGSANGVYDTVGTGTYSDAGSAFATSDYVRIGNDSTVSSGSISAAFDSNYWSLQGSSSVAVVGGQATAESFGGLVANNFTSKAALGDLSGTWSAETAYGNGTKATDISVVATTGSDVESLTGKLADGCTFSGWAKPYLYGRGVDRLVLKFDATTCAASTDVVAGATYRGAAFIWADSSKGHHAIIGVMTDDRKHGHTWNIVR